MQIFNSLLDDCKDDFQNLNNSLQLFSSLQTTGKRLQDNVNNHNDKLTKAQEDMEQYLKSIARAANKACEQAKEAFNASGLSNVKVPYLHVLYEIPLEVNDAKLQLVRMPEQGKSSMPQDNTMVHAGKVDAPTKKRRMILDEEGCDDNNTANSKPSPSQSKPGKSIQFNAWIH